jgi:hypothetical protein
MASSLPRLFLAHRSARGEGARHADSTRPGGAELSRADLMIPRDLATGIRGGWRSDRTLPRWKRRRSRRRRGSVGPSTHRRESMPPCSLRATSRPRHARRARGSRTRPCARLRVAPGALLPCAARGSPARARAMGRRMPPAGAPRSGGRSLERCDGQGFGSGALRWWYWLFC